MGLLKYLGKRLVTIVFSVVVIVIITYCLMYAAPGNFFDIQRFQSQSNAMGYGSTMTQADIEMLRKGFEKKYGLDQPLWKQIANYLVGAVQWKFGPAFSNPSMTIEALIAQKFPVTLALGLMAIGLAILVGIPLGVIAALRRNTALDYGANFAAMVGQVIPAYTFAVIFIFLFSVALHWLPTSGWGKPREMILPVICLSLGPLGAIARFTRVSLLDTLSQDYVRTAYAKGGKERTVIVRHALRNSLIPIATILGPNLAFILAGSAVYIENQFRVPGIGQLFVNAAGYRDYPLIITATLVLTLTVMILNLLVDLVYALLDPRIKLE
jgi:peptide/nickel transport system permease protein